jgi:hypothetical protein
VVVGVQSEVAQKPASYPARFLRRKYMDTMYNTSKFKEMSGALWEEHKPKGGSNNRVLTGIFGSEEKEEVAAAHRQFTQ